MRFRFILNNTPDSKQAKEVFFSSIPLTCANHGYN